MATLGGQPPETDWIDGLLGRLVAEDAESEVVYDLAKAWPDDRAAELLLIAVRPGPDLYQMAIIDGLVHRRQFSPAGGQEIRSILASAFEDPASLPQDTAGPLVSLAIAIEAVEAAEGIERAFASDLVDVGFCGPWEQVRDDLGVQGLGLPMPSNAQNSIHSLREMMSGIDQRSA